MPMRRMSGHCFCASTTMLLLLAGSLCFLWTQGLSARITPRGARRTAAANAFNRTSKVGVVGHREGLLLPVWATRAEEQVRLDWKRMAAVTNVQGNNSSSSRLVGSSLPWNDEQDFQQQVVRQEQPLRIPAEFEPVSTVIMAWDEAIRDMIPSMITSINQAGSRTWLLIPHNQNVADILPNNNNQNVRTIKVNYDSIWTRDYGPIGGILDDDDDDTDKDSSIPNTSRGGSSSRAIVNAVYQFANTRVYDDQVPCHLANSFRIQLPCRSTNIVMDGGNLMLDGQGGLFMTSITYDWNDHFLTPQQVDQELKSAFGVQRIYALDYAKLDGREPADGTGHLDMFVKILAPCVVIVAEAPRHDTVYWGVLNKAATFFSNLSCQLTSNGSNSVYQVHRVPGWQDQGTWYTYTNSLIVNDRVIVPSYDYSTTAQQQNQQALAVYQAAAPHLTVDLVNSDFIIHLGGAVHCLTREIPRLTRRRPSFS